MSYLDELGLKAAERLEATLGAWVALASYERLVDETRPRGEARLEARAIGGALRCAIALGDEARITRFLERWTRVPADVDAPFHRDLLRDAARSRAHLLARRLATAEVERRPTARALYALGRALELEGRFDAAVYLRAAEAAVSAVDDPVRSRAIGLVIEDACRRFDDGGLGPEERATLLALARGAPRMPTPPASQRLASGRILMMSMRPFERAQGLSLLADVLRDPAIDAALREDALARIAEHVDAWGQRLHPAERDRIQTALRATSDEKRRAALLARFALVLELPLAGGRDTLPRAMLERIRTVAPELSAATYEAPRSEASARSLAELEIALEKKRVPAVAWFVVLDAVRTPSPSIRDGGIRLVAPLLARSLAPPSFGYRPLAAEVVRVDPDVGLALYRLATDAREPDARSELVISAKRIAYRALARGDEPRAVLLLREAKRLATEETLGSASAAE